MKKKIVFKSLLKVVVFVLIFSTLATSALSVLSVKMCPRSYNSVKDFYKEEKNTADAVYIDSSNVLAYWNPMLAWEEYGIAVPNFACNAMPISCLEYFLKEAHKTQPDAVYIMNINTLGEKGTTQVNKLHRVFIYTPFSINKAQSLQRFFNFYDIPLEDRPEYCFPMIRFHSNWNNITDEDFDLESTGFKGADKLPGYLRMSKDYSEKYTISNDFVDVSQDLEDSINHLLDYCDSEKLKVLFVTVPQAHGKKLVSKFNTVNKIISQRGYTTLNLMDDVEELKIFTNKDFYDNKHTNIHGSSKFTYYLSQYLIENYGFKNKTEDERYSSWNEAYDEYIEIAKQGILDFELNPDYDPTILSEPKHLTAVATSEDISLTWEAVEGADGYKIYEKCGLDGKWNSIGETEELGFSDKKFESKAEYYYRVVPFKDSDGKKSYGDFSYKGIYVVAKKHA